MRRIHLLSVLSVPLSFVVLFFASNALGDRSPVLRSMLLIVILLLGAVGMVVTYFAMRALATPKYLSVPYQICGIFYLISLVTWMITPFFATAGSYSLAIVAFLTCAAVGLLSIILGVVAYLRPPADLLIESPLNQ